MFGYVRIDKPELRVREYEAYRGLYCGLCRAMGKCTGCSSRLTLSYDFTFLLLFRTVVRRERVTYAPRRCAAHPFRKRMTADPTGETDYVACAAALLTYYKCADDLSDEHGGKRLAAAMLYPTAGRMRSRAMKRFPELARLDECIGDAMRVIAEEERKKIPSADHYADLSGGLLAEIFAFGLPKEDARVARTLGRRVGKWIYLIDAFDDLEEDVRRGRFNPLCLAYPDSLSPEGREALRERLRVALLNELREAENALDLVEFSGYGDLHEILMNVLYRGMPKTAEHILSGKHIGERASANGSVEGEQ